MSNANKAIKTTLKKILVPFLQSEGFTGKFPAYTRRENGMLHLLEVQFDKWGGGFFLEFATHPPGDKVTSWGEVVPENKLTVVYAPFETRARLQEKGTTNSTRNDWFRYEALDQEGCENLVTHVIELFPQVNAWLRKKTVGPNISATE